VGGAGRKLAMFSVFWTFWLAACVILWIAAARDLWSVLLCIVLTVPQTILLWRRRPRVEGVPSVRRAADK
jgi:hypothetical protein